MNSVAYRKGSVSVSKSPTGSQTSFENVKIHKKLKKALSHQKKHLRHNLLEWLESNLRIRRYSKSVNSSIKQIFLEASIKDDCISPDLTSIVEKIKTTLDNVDTQLSSGLKNYLRPPKYVDDLYSRALELSVLNGLDGASLANDLWTTVARLIITDSMSPNKTFFGNLNCFIEIRESLVEGVLREMRRSASQKSIQAELVSTLNTLTSRLDDFASQTDQLISKFSDEIRLNYPVEFFVKCYFSQLVTSTIPIKKIVGSVQKDLVGELPRSSDPMSSQTVTPTRLKLFRDGANTMFSRVLGRHKKASING